MVEVTQGTMANLNIKSDKDVIRKGMYKTRQCTSKSDKLCPWLSTAPLALCCPLLRKHTPEDVRGSRVEVRWLSSRLGCPVAADR